MSTQLNAQSPKIPTFLPYLICFLAATFYLYEFVLQVSPSVMTQPMMRDFQIDAAGIGVISAFYYYGYAPMQLPAGILYDRFGPRILLTIAIIICSTGAMLFSFAVNPAMASFGRLFTGIGSAFSFIGALVLVSRWFPARYFALLAGIVQTLSSVGAIVGESPFAKAVGWVGWRHTMLYAAIFGYLLALIVWLIVRDGPQRVTHKRKPGKFYKGVWVNLRKVCSSRQTWWVALYAFCSWAPIVTFAALWGVPFLAKRYDISTATAAAACSLIWVGIGVGSPFIGWLSDKMHSRRKPLFACAAIGVVSSFCIIYLPIPWQLSAILLFFFGIAAAGQSLSFGVVQDNNPPVRVGTAIGLNNMAVVIGGAIFQPLVGLIMHKTWAGVMVNGIPSYSLANFRYALFVIPLCYLVGVIVSRFFLRETGCKHQFEREEASTGLASSSTRDN